MTFKFTNKSEQTQVRRTYACDDCGIEWVEWVDRDAPVPECWKCMAASRAAVGAPPTLGTHSQAIDAAWEAAQAMGMTDMNDQQRVGDIAFKPPSPPTTQEVEQMMRQSAEMAREMEVPRLSEAPQVGMNGQPVEGGMSPAQMGAQFWGGGGAQAMPQQAASALIGSAQVGAQIARAEGRDPIAMLHHSRRPFRVEVVAADHKSPATRDI